MDIQDLYTLWLKETKKSDEELYDELSSIAGDAAAIEDRLYRELEFGTGGLRGVLGAGTNRMNRFTVAKATQGYSNYLVRHFARPSVAIAYDSRMHSRDFADTAARVFAGNGIRVHIYPRLMPTPSLSFAVRELRCSGGIVITASHNPAEYNGYKVYGADGCQITTDAAKEIQQEINGVDPFEGVHSADSGDALICEIPDAVRESYLEHIASSSLLPKNISRDMTLVYTPLNGAGISCVPENLRRCGFDKIIIPEQQAQPDGHFATCPYPNPEIRQALEVGLVLAEKTGSDLLLATDPDCDRVGAAVRTSEGCKLISGNEMGVLLFDFVCAMRTKNGTMPENPVAVKTIVTTPMAAKLAAHYGVELRNVLTGFKYIGEQIGLLEREAQEKRYIFGFEESYGYLSASFVRDKDAVNASLLICEMFAYYKNLGKTLIDRLNELYALYGHYSAKLLSYTFGGSTGLARMKSLMQSLRTQPPRSLGGLEVEALGDYLSGEIIYSDGRKEQTCLPSSDVLRFILSGGCEVTVRPSGTEPKLKVYLTGVSANADDSKRIIEKLEAELSKIINA